MKKYSFHRIPQYAIEAAKLRVRVHTLPSADAARTAHELPSPSPKGSHYFQPLAVFECPNLRLPLGLSDEISPSGQTLLSASPPLLPIACHSDHRQSEVPTLATGVKTTISACVVLGQRHRIRLPAEAVSAPRCSRAGAYPPRPFTDKSSPQGTTKVSYRDKGDSHPYLRA